MPTRLLALLAFVPLVAVTVAAGVSTYPDPIKPCISTYSKGLRGKAGPGGITSDKLGNVWATSGFTDDLLRINRKTKVITQWHVPGHPGAHDPTVRPLDQTVWFSGLNNQLVKFDPTTETFTLFGPLPKGSQPHGVVWGEDDNLYLAAQGSGKFYRFDPRTKKFTEIPGLTPKSRPHGILEVPGGGLWVNLEGANKIAHFDTRTQKFDKFVAMPPDSAPHQSAFDPKRHQLVITTLRANKIVTYNLDSGKVTAFASPLARLKFEGVIQPTSRFPRLVAVAIDAQDHDAWITRLGIGIVRFDLDTHKTKEVTCGAGIPGASLVITRADDQIWYSDPINRSFGLVHPDGIK